MTVSFDDSSQTLKPLVRAQLDRGRVDDLGYMLVELVEAYINAAERAPQPHRRLACINRAVLMKNGADRVDREGNHLNDFEHLSGGLVRLDEGSRTWLGPVTVAALERVLFGKVGWTGSDEVDDQRLIEAFASTPISELSMTVDEVVNWAFIRNSAHKADGRIWGIDGLAVVERPRTHVSIDRVKPPESLQYVMAHDLPEAHDKLGPFVGLYDRARAEAHAIVFGGERRRQNAQVVPRHPGLLLSVAYTLEFLTVWQRSDALVDNSLVDDRRDMWGRFAIPALAEIDPLMPRNAAEKLCGRAADEHPWLTAVLPERVRRRPRASTEDPAAVRETGDGQEGQ